MKIRIQCTANLGDFMNAIPVISGLVNSYGKVDFVIRSDMRKFNGIKEFLLYQDLFTDVNFDDDVILYGNYIDLSSWTREDKNDKNRPIETCRYENWLRDKYNLDFQVDDSFEIKVQDLDIEVDQSQSYCGDRWNGPGIDGRRASWTLTHLEGLNFLNYQDSLMKNAYIIKNSKKPFISTFTGISGIADLLNKEQIVLWGEDIRNWDNKPIEYSFEKHFYGNRKSKLMYLGDFEVSKIDQYYPV
jgi:hypothetical protein